MPDERSDLPRRAVGAVKSRLSGPTLGRVLTHRAIGLKGCSSATFPSFIYGPLVHRLSKDCDSVLDVGTGLMRSLKQSPCAVKIGLDAYRPYLERRKDPDAVPINASALEVERLFLPRSLHLVTLIDVLEHFAPDDAGEVLRQAEAVASRRVVIFTPRGLFPQEGDALGMGGEEFQRHRSTWEPEDLTARGYRVAILSRFHDARNASFVEAFGPEAPPKDGLLAWKDRP